MGDIVMPRLSDTMEEGTILRWYKRDGEQVHRGEELVEIETDKATMTHEAAAEAFVSYLLGPAGLATLTQDGFKLVAPPTVKGTGMPSSLQSLLS